MALLFCDSFNHYQQAQILQKYTAGSNATILTSSGRNPSYSPNQCLGLPYTSFVSLALPNSNQLVVGLALNPGVGLGANTIFLQFQDQNTIQIAVSVSAAGQIEVFGPNSTFLASTPASMLPANVFTYIEVSASFSTNPTGTVQININGVSQASATNVVTAVNDSFANIISLVNPASDNVVTISVDDFYVCDGTGTVNNTFLGDIRVAMSLPSGNGRVNSWTRTGGTSSGNYTAVDDNPPDGDTSYVASSTVAAIDAYTFSSIGTPAAIVAVQLVASARKDDSGSRVVALGFGNSTTDVFNAGTSVANNYSMIRSELNTNPISGVAWVPTDLATAQIAVKVVS